MFKFYFILIMMVSFLDLPQATAEGGLVIHGTEIGIGKFHRHDNKVHPYGEKNIWKNSVLPDGVNGPTPIVRENQDGSFTVFFSTLEELLKSMVDLSNEKKKKIEVFNLNAHGLPGAMWFPENDEVRQSSACQSWVTAASGADEANYNQYYSPLSKSEIMSIRVMSYMTVYKADCTTGLKQWKRVISKVADIRNAFAPGAQLHLFSCMVGYGRAGSYLVTRLAPLLFSSENAKVQAAMSFGLGDWSMPEGMGFWDYQTDEQLDHDNSGYPVDREDRKIMQKGSIRLAQFLKGKWQTGILADLDFMFGYLDSYSLESKEGIQHLVAEEKIPETISRSELWKNIRFPIRARIPGTGAYVEVQ